MRLLRPMTGDENTRLRLGIYGKAGSGKTRTATEIAIGLALDLGDRRPIAFIDTEGNGVDHVAPIVRASGLELLGVKTRDFRTAVEAMREAEAASCSVVIVDSASHLWTNVMESYLEDRNQESLSIQDWGPIKRTWRDFPEAFLTLQAHTIVCGRSGGVYEGEKDPRTGKWEIRQVDTKMRAEGELEHEPSLLLEMFLIPKRAATGVATDTGYINRAVILKDRTDSLNGQTIDFPTYADFAPIIQKLSPGAHVALDQSKAARGALFGSKDWTRYREKIRKEELIDRLKATFDLHEIGGNSVEARKIRATLFERHLGTPSAKEAFGRLEVYELEEGVRRLEAELEGKASPPEPAPEEELPDLMEARACLQCGGTGASDGGGPCRICKGTGSPDVRPDQLRKAQEPPPPSEENSTPSANNENHSESAKGAQRSMFRGPAPAADEDDDMPF